MRLSLEKFGFASPQNALWNCQMAAVSGQTAENLPAPSQHWWWNSPNRQDASHYNPRGRKTPFTLQSVNCIKVYRGKNGLFAFAEPWQSGNLVSLIYYRCLTWFLSLYLCFISCPTWKMYLLFPQWRRLRRAENCQGACPGLLSLESLGQRRINCSLPQMDTLLLPPVCNCPAIQGQDLGLCWNSTIWEEEIGQCKAEVDMPFRAIRFYSDNLFR